MALKQALIATGLLVTLAQTAQAEGMNAPASLLPPGYKPAAAPALAPLPATVDVPSYAPVAISGADDESERTGMGEADLAPAAPSEAMAMTAMPAAATGMGEGQGDYVDIPPMAPLAAAPQAMPQPQAAYTQGITTGPKAYNEGNFTFKAR